MAVPASAGAAAVEPLVHYALFHTDEKDYLGGVLPFLAESFAVGEPALVMAPGRALDLLRAGLGESAAEQVSFLDMSDVLRDPARIIPAAHRFAQAHPGRRIRVVGEPIWPGRSAAEIREAVRHEALVNVLFAGVDATVCCPYDSASLESAVIADAHRTHPHRRVQGGYRSSPHYPNPAIMAALSEHLPAVPAAAEAWGFHHRQDVAMLRRRVADRARRGGLRESRVQDLVLAVGEAISNTLEHSTGSGTLHAWWDADTLVCEVADRGQIADPAVGRVAPQAQAERGRGVWMINQVCDLVELHSGPAETRIRMHMRVAAGPI